MRLPRGGVAWAWLLAVATVAASPLFSLLLHFFVCLLFCSSLLLSFFLFLFFLFLCFFSCSLSLPLFSSFSSILLFLLFFSFFGSVHPLLFLSFLCLFSASIFIGREGQWKCPASIWSGDMAGWMGAPAGDLSPLFFLSVVGHLSEL